MEYWTDEDQENQSREDLLAELEDYENSLPVQMAGVKAEGWDEDIACLYTLMAGTPHADGERYLAVTRTGFEVAA